MVFNGLLEAVAEAVRDGMVPKPMSGETVDDFRFRCAHAGSLLGVRWSQVQAEQAMQAAQAESAQTDPLNTISVSPGRPGDATVTSLPAPSSQDDLGDAV